MAHFALCPRVEMPLAAPTTFGTAMTSNTLNPAESDRQLTWQQVGEFATGKPNRGRRKRKASKPAPSELKATNLPNKLLATNHKPTTVRPKTQPSNIQPKARGKILSPSLPHRIEQRTEVDTASPPQPPGNLAKKPRSHRKKRKPHSRSQSADMTKPLSGVFVPPHLRNRPSEAAQAKTEVRLGNGISITTPPASDKSRNDELAQTSLSSQQITIQDPAPPTPATTAEKPPKHIDEHNGWDNPIPEQQLAPPKRGGNPRWPRADRAPKEKHVWIKQSEIPKKPSCGSQSDGGMDIRSNSDGDPSYDVKKLMAWNGDWLPPPEEWAARKGFTHRHFGQAIEQWVNEHSKNCTKLMNVDLPDFLGVEGADGKWVNKDLVPRYWLHDSIDDAAPRRFWEELPQRAPDLLSDFDIMEDPPYWERWEQGELENSFMKTLLVPDARIDTADHENELHNPFAMLSIEDRLARINKVIESKKRQRDLRQSRPVASAVLEGAQLPDRRLQPKTNIYLRPVQPADVREIMAIYNHYIKHTVHAAELDEQTEVQISSWIDNIVQAGLPCLVAVSKRNQRKGAQGYVSETIVGFIHLEEYESLSSMYRYTFELALYVHPGYLRQGIGKCLLDQMMFMANTGYNKKGGYEWVNEFEYLKNGKRRTIKTIIVGCHFARGDEADWVADYLGEYGFRKAGRFSHVGYKVGKVVDKILFQLQTTETIDSQATAMAQA